MIDAQIGHEKTLTAILPALAGSNIIYGMGMLEMGIVFDFSQLLIDAEIVRMIQRVLKGVTVNRETLALDTIKAVGPGGNFLTQDHTLRHFRREQSAAKLIDRTMRETWEAAGSSDLYTRANEAAIEIINHHQPLPLADDIVKGLADIVAAAEEEKGLR